MMLRYRRDMSAAWGGQVKVARGQLLLRDILTPNPTRLAVQKGE